MNGDESDYKHQAAVLFQNFISGEPENALTLLEQHASLHGYTSAIFNILEPALEEVGRNWEQEKISLAAGYLAGKIAEDILVRAAELQEAIPFRGGIAVIGNIEDDYHSLGRKMLGTFLKAAGWKVIDLGNDISAKTFVDAAVENNAHVIGVSAMMFTTARTILEVRKEIDSRGLSDQIKLAVGGAVFKLRPELVTEVGGDGTVTNGVDAPALFNSLREKIKL